MTRITAGGFRHQALFDVRRSLARAAVLQRLRMDTGHEYDPVVVEALATVLQRPDFDWRSG